MNPNTTGAVYPGDLRASARGFRRGAAVKANALPEFTMPSAPAPNREDLLTLTAALNHMSVRNALLPGQGGGL